MKQGISLLSEELAEMVLAETKAYFYGGEDDQPLEPKTFKENVKKAVSTFFIDYDLAVVKRQTLKAIEPSRW